MLPQLRREDGVEVTGSALWDAGLALAAHLEGALRDRTSLSVLEIGAGVGAAGLALAAGGHDVLLTDFAPEVLGLLEANVRRNRLQRRAAVQKLDWNEPPPLAVARRSWDLIVAADILYGLPSFAPLHRLLEHLCARPETRVIIACGNRQRGSREDLTFLRELEQRGTLSVVETAEVSGAGVGRWGGGVVECHTLMRKGGGEGGDASSDDDEFLELMEELELEEAAARRADDTKEPPA